MLRQKVLIVFVLLFASCPAWAIDYYIEACPNGGGCANSQKVWIKIFDPYAGLDLEIVSTVVGGGLLMWAVGAGIGLVINIVRKGR